MEPEREYQERIRGQLGQMDAQIRELMAQADNSDYDEYLTDIRNKQESAKVKLAELEEADGEAWQDLRAQLDQAVSEVQNALFVVTASSG